MEARRGHRYAGPLAPRREERHYVSAIIGAVGVATSVGMSAYGTASQPSGKPNAGQRHELELQQQRQEQAFQIQQMLQPYLLEQMGLQASYGPNGQILNVTKRPQTDAERKATEIQGLAQDKVLKGLRGELDIDPATERALSEDRRMLGEQLGRTQGQSGDLSTASQTAINKQRESDRITREAVRRGEMTTAESIANNQANQQFREQQYRGGLMTGLPSNAQNLNLSAFDYPGFNARQNFLSGTLGANRYGAYGNIFGQGLSGLSTAYSRIPSGTPAPGPTMQTPGGEITRGPYYSGPQYGPQAPIQYEPEAGG